MDLLEKLFYITDRLEYPNHWVGYNGRDKHFDGSKRIFQSVTIAPNDLNDPDDSEEEFIVDAKVIPEAFKDRTHFCAEFAMADGKKLLIIRHDKKKPYSDRDGECYTIYTEQVTVYWNRKKIGEMAIKNEWLYVTSSRSLESGVIANEELWKAEVLPFHDQLKAVYEKWYAKLNADLEAKKKKKASPDEI